MMIGQLGWEKIELTELSDILQLCCPSIDFIFDRIVFGYCSYSRNCLLSFFYIASSRMFACSV